MDPATEFVGPVEAPRPNAFADMRTTENAEGKQLLLEPLTVP